MLRSQTWLPPKLSGADVSTLTVHFTNRVREYAGAGYAQSMLENCRTRFAGCPTHISFRVCDLSEAFSDIRVFSFTTGAELEDQSKLRGVEDPWLYYLYKIRQQG